MQTQGVFVNSWEKKGMKPLIWLGQLHICEFKVKSICKKQKKAINLSWNQNGAWMNHMKQTFTILTTT